jgi:c-di-GMP-binding flagellar brake protein YcgR
LNFFDKLILFAVAGSKAAGKLQGANMLDHLIKAGCKAEFSLDSEGDFSQGLLSQVEQKLSGRELVLLTPIMHGRLAKFPLGAEKCMCFYASDGLLSYVAVVIRHISDQSVDLTKVRLVTDGARMQRRAFYRFGCSLQAKLALPSADGSSSLFDARVLDIGGGGAKIASPVEVSERSKVKMAVKLYDEYLVASGRVLQASDLEGAEYKKQFRLEFLAMPPSEQEKIITFIFKEQRKALQKRYEA